MSLHLRQQHTHVRLSFARRGASNPLWVVRCDRDCRREEAAGVVTEMDAHGFHRLLRAVLFTPTCQDCGGSGFLAGLTPCPECSGPG